jgi:hypothetical protein
MMRVIESHDTALVWRQSRGSRLHLEKPVVFNLENVSLTVRQLVRVGPALEFEAEIGGEEKLEAHVGAAGVDQLEADAERVRADCRAAEIHVDPVELGVIRIFEIFSQRSAPQPRVDFRHAAPLVQKLLRAELQILKKKYLSCGRILLS